MAHFTGMGGTVTVAATPYPVSQWAYTENNETQDVTDTASNGWVERIAGVRSGEATFTAFYNTDDLLGVFAPGTSIALSLVAGSVSAPPTVSGTFIVSSVTITNNAKTPVEFQCTAQSTGTVTS